MYYIGNIYGRISRKNAANVFCSTDYFCTFSNRVYTMDKLYCYSGFRNLRIDCTNKPLDAAEVRVYGKKTELILFTEFIVLVLLITCRKNIGS